MGKKVSLNRNETFNRFTGKTNTAEGTHNTIVVVLERSNKFTTETSQPVFIIMTNVIVLIAGESAVMLTRFSRGVLLTVATFVILKTHGIRTVTLIGDGSRVTVSFDWNVPIMRHTY
uniref:Uncharacterized protein n=1 Tax=Glossina pallidipes TaxID=7398 RepID=A0A1B0AJ44_GLOPL